ncbi:MAG: Fic family protein [Aeromicrobium sp.]
MEPTTFLSDEFGVVRYDETETQHWFDPNPLPRDLELASETQIALSRADSALGRLDGVASLLSNPDLISRPYAAREAVASSRIEGTYATISNVYESEAGKVLAFADAVRLVEAYRIALSEGLAEVSDQPLTLDVLLSAHRKLLRDAPEADHAGAWRKQSVWVGAPTDRPETAVYIPPHADRVPELMEEWLEWHRSAPRLPLLVRVALLHYQFLTIHPFQDGNGRVGRMLIQMILEEEHALSAPLLYVSAYFANRRREYYDRLQDVRQRGEIQEWLQFFLTAVEVQANDGVDRAVRLMNLRERYRTELSGTRSRATDLVDMLFQNPVVSSKQVQEGLEVTNQGALNLLRGLEERGWLRSVDVQGRGSRRFWIAPEIVGLIDDESELDVTVG